MKAFAYYLHVEKRYDVVKGIVINSQTDPNIGHDFKQDMFQFPGWMNVDVLCDKITILNKEITNSLRRKGKKWTPRNGQLFILNANVKQNLTLGG